MTDFGEPTWINLWTIKNRVALVQEVNLYVRQHVHEEVDKVLDAMAPIIDQVWDELYA